MNETETPRPTEKAPPGSLQPAGSANWTHAEWIAEGERRFGPSQLKWRFVCPMCGHVQAPEDFRPYKPRGATAEDARYNCIGRYAGPKRKAFGGEGEGPCDYTSGGLFDVRPWSVSFPDGAVLKTFAFADSPNIVLGQKTSDANKPK